MCVKIAVVTGSCTAGGAYVPTMCDEAVIVERAGSLYLGGPPLVQVATGEVLTSEELGGAKIHCSISGCTDHFASSEEEALQITRAIVGALNLPLSTGVRRTEAQPPSRQCSDEDFASLLYEDPQEWPVLEVSLLKCIQGRTAFVLYS